MTRVSQAQQANSYCGLAHKCASMRSRYVQWRRSYNKDLPVSPVTPPVTDSEAGFGSSAVTAPARVQAEIDRFERVAVRTPTGGWLDPGVGPGLLRALEAFRRPVRAESGDAPPPVTTLSNGVVSTPEEGA
jgi:hypothetical protein